MATTNESSPSGKNSHSPADNLSKRSAQRPSKFLSQLATSLSLATPSTWLTIGLSTIALVLSLGPIPFLVRILFDEAFPNENAAQIAGLAAAMLGLQLAASVTTVLAARRIARVAAQSGFDRRLDVVDAALNAPLKKVTSQDRGLWLESTTNLILAIEKNLSLVYASLLPALISATAILMLLAIINWMLFVAMLVFLPILVAVLTVSRRSVFNAFTARHRATIAVHEETTAMLDNLETLRVFGQEPWQRRRFIGRNEQLRPTSERFLVAQSVHGAFTQSTIAAVVTVILVGGGVLISRGEIDPATLVSFIAGLAVLRQPLGSIGNVVGVLAAGEAAHRQVAELIAAVGTSRPRADSPSSPPCGHDLEQLVADAVSFVFDDGNEVLQGVDLRLRRGRVVALVGENGAGKTTLLRVLVGLIETPDGRVYGECSDGHRWDTTASRARIAVNSQVSSTVPGTLRENIDFGRSLSDEQILWACGRVGADAVIASAVDGLDTEIGRQRPLSAGQLQRIGLARAVAGRPDFLLLDEPTNHLDPAVVARVLETVRQLDNRPGVLIVSHDERALDLADEVYRLADGKLHQVDR